MQRIEGVETVFGDGAFDVSTCAIIKEDDDWGEDCPGNAVVHHQRESEKNLDYRLRGEADVMVTEPRNNCLMS